MLLVKIENKIMLQFLTVLNFFMNKKNTITAKKIDMDFDIITHQSLGDSVKELVEVSFKIYSQLLSIKKPITIICGGQSPSYFCLAMMNFNIFNPDIINIIILPHSKDGIKSKNQYNENYLYSQRLKEKNIQLRKNVTIIDGVHSGTGIMALESALKYYSPFINITKIAINNNEYVSNINVDKEYIVYSAPIFSDTFPRLVVKYPVKDFNNSSKFITTFINLKSNPIAQMIIDISKTYHKVAITETLWYKLNNTITPEIKIKQEEYKINQEKVMLRTKLKKEGGTFIPEIIDNPKRYKCPLCKQISGTLCVKNPENLSLLTHNLDCLNKFKIPKEIMI